MSLSLFRIMFQTKVVEEFKTHFIFSKFPENPAVYAIMWRSMVKPVADDNMAHCVLDI